MKPVRFEYVPQPRQMVLHGTLARQILFGGSVGGGKSMALRWDAIRFCLENSGCQAYLFRRTMGELEQSHIVRIKQELPEHLGLGRWNTTKSVYEFRNGSNLWMCYCEKEQDVTRYQGAEMHWLGIDEATHLTEF